MQDRDFSAEAADRPMVRIRTVVADDSIHWLKPLRAFLDDEPAIDLVAIARDGLEAIGHVAALRAELVLLDTRMPRLDGFKTAAIIRTRFPEVKILMMSSDDDPYLRDQCRAHGADAFVAKSDVADQLLPTIFRICADGIASSPSGQAAPEFQRA